QADIAFGILEINGIDLVRHSGRTHLTLLEPLLEVTKGYIAPDISVQVQQNRVRASNRIKKRRHPVVRFNLNGVLVLGQAEPLNDLCTERRPVHLGIGGNVGVVISRGAVHFGEGNDGFYVGNGPLESGRHISELFADGGRTSRLSVWSRKEGLVGV